MKINLKCAINSLGYGITGMNVLKHLLKRNIEVAHFPIGFNNPETYDDVIYLNKGTENKQHFGYDAPCLKIWHQFDMGEWAGKYKLYGMPIFELDTFATHEIHHLRFCDELIAPSLWAKKLINKQLPEKKCGIAPLGVDRLVFNESANVETNKCIFFNCGKWEIRKGHDFICSAFLETFSDTDDVELWMMCDNPFFKPEETTEWEQLYNHPKIRLIHRVQTQSEVAKIMNITSCGVFPSRAEGWNLELLEMMSCGKHVIATDYSGHTEFCTNENCMLVNVNELETAFDGKWFHGVGNWAFIGDAQLTQLSNHMQNFYKQWSIDRSIINKPGIKTAQEFTWENTVTKVLEIVKEK